MTRRNKRSPMVPIIGSKIKTNAKEKEAVRVAMRNEEKRREVIIADRCVKSKIFLSV